MTEHASFPPSAESELERWLICRAENSAAHCPPTVASAVEAQLNEALRRELRPGLDVQTFDNLAARGADWQSLLPGAAVSPEHLTRCRDLLFLRYRLQLEQKDKTAAQRSYRLLQRMFPAAPANLLLRGRLAFLRSDLTGAQQYFRQSLVHPQTVVGALSGLADVAGARKDWATAAELRLQALQAAESLPAADPDRCCQALRYGLALCELGAYGPASALLRKVVHSGVYGASPEELQQLLQLFCTRLYSPATVARLLDQSSMEFTGALGERARTCLQSAYYLAHTYGSLYAGSALQTEQTEQTEQRAAGSPMASARHAQLLLAMCAFEAGDPEGAYFHADRADEDGDASCQGHDRDVNAEGMAAQYLLTASAEIIASEELASIQRFASAAAQRVPPESAASEEAQLYAALIMLRDGALRAQAEAQLARLGTPLASWLLHRVRARSEDSEDQATPEASGAAVALPEPPPPLAAQAASETPDVARLLSHVTLWRAALRSAGLSRMQVARLTAALYPHCARAVGPLATTTPVECELSWVAAAIRVGARFGITLHQQSEPSATGDPQRP